MVWKQKQSNKDSSTFHLTFILLFLSDWMLFNAQLENVARIVRSSFYAVLGLQHLVVYTIITILAIMDRLRTIPLKKIQEYECSGPSI